MKTLTQTVIKFVALSLLTVAFAQTQAVQSADIALASESSTASAPVPSPPTPPTVSAASQNVFELTNALSYVSQTGSSDMVLVIPSEQTKTEDLIAINEDMNVMSRIFEKNLEQDRIASSSMFIRRNDVYLPFIGSSRNEIQSMYLQGYGAVFMLKVDFPLSPSSEAQQEQQDTEKQEESDSVWKQTKQEIYEPGRANTRRQPGKQQVKYDSEKVENLKTTLIKTLKHAKNIRNLKSDESVILTVAGGGESAGTKITAINVAGNNQVIVEEKSADGKSKMRIINGNTLDDIGLSTQTVLVIRAKRSDIDAFAKDELDLDKFRTHVQMFTYPYLGSVKVRGNSL
jgi:hypothetical protein